LHVRDIAHEDTDAQSEDVYSVLSQLGIDEDGHAKVIEVWNKIDLLGPEALEAMENVKTSERKPQLVSAITGEGVEGLLTMIEDEISGSDDVMEIILPIEALGRLPWIYKNCHVIERNDLETGEVSMRFRGNRHVRAELKSFERENGNVA
ncbi:MAG: GTPase HflX, partial [Pseudomonadota bacterium]